MLGASAGAAAVMVVGLAYAEINANPAALAAEVAAVEQQLQVCAHAAWAGGGLLAAAMPVWRAATRRGWATAAGGTATDEAWRARCALSAGAADGEGGGGSSISGECRQLKGRRDPVNGPQGAAWC